MNAATKAAVDIIDILKGATTPNGEPLDDDATAASLGIIASVAGAIICEAHDDMAARMMIMAAFTSRVAAIAAKKATS